MRDAFPVLSLADKTPVFIVRGRSLEPAYINGSLAVRRYNGILKALVYRQYPDGEISVDLMSVKSIREREFKLEG